MESATVEPDILPVKPKHLFSKETAKEFSRRAVKARQQREIERQNEEKVLRTALVLMGSAPTVTLTLDQEIWVRDRISRVREQIEILDKVFLDTVSAGDQKGIKAICDSIARLAEVERVLAGRPDPGSRRPGREKASRDRPPAEPIE